MSSKRHGRLLVKQSDALVWLYQDPVTCVRTKTSMKPPRGNHPCYCSAGSAQPLFRAEAAVFLSLSPHSRRASGRLPPSSPATIDSPVRGPGRPEHPAPSPAAAWPPRLSVRVGAVPVSRVATASCRPVPSQSPARPRGSL